MPNRKQRRRRTKERRHDYEYVYVDEEGRELAEPPEPEQREPARRNGTAARSRSRQPAGRRGRKIEPPSLQRVVRRALILGPVMFLTVHFVVADLTLTQEVVQTGFLLLIFLPMSYAMDALMYRLAAKRGAAAPRR